MVTLRLDTLKALNDGNRILEYNEFKSYIITLYHDPLIFGIDLDSRLYESLKYSYDNLESAWAFYNTLWGDSSNLWGDSDSIKISWTYNEVKDILDTLYKELSDRIEYNEYKALTEKILKG